MRTANHFGVGAELYRHLTSSFIRLTQNHDLDRLALQLPRTPPNRRHSVARVRPEPPPAKIKRRTLWAKNDAPWLTEREKFKVFSSI